MIPLLFLDDLIQTGTDIAFVVQVIVFSYLMFWLYMSFKDSSLVFGLSVIISGYLIFVHGISMTFLMLIFFAFVIFGSQLQMLLMFGVFPLLGREQTGEPKPNPKEMDELSMKYQQGTISEGEMARLQELSHQSQQGQQPLMRRMM